jgi:hypothetical protein
LRNLTGTLFSSLLSITSPNAFPWLKQTNPAAELTTVQFQLSNYVISSHKPLDITSINFKFDPTQSHIIKNVAVLRSLQGSIAAIDVDEENGKERMQVTLCGETVDHRFSVRIQNEEDAKHLSASYYPTENVTVEQMLASVVGSHTSTAFDKLINNLPVDYATTRLCIKGLDMVLQCLLYQTCTRRILAYRKSESCKPVCMLRLRRD